VRRRLRARLAARTAECESTRFQQQRVAVRHAEIIQLGHAAANQPWDHVSGVAPGEQSSPKANDCRHRHQGFLRVPAFVPERPALGLRDTAIHVPADFDAEVLSGLGRSQDRDLHKFNGITVRDPYGDCQFAGRDWLPPPWGPAVGCGTRR
jgi:hypothetical protein